MVLGSAANMLEVLQGVGPHCLAQVRPLNQRVVPPEYIFLHLLVDDITLNEKPRKRGGAFTP
jgi:hypothetical protein